MKRISIFLLLLTLFQYSISADNNVVAVNLKIRNIPSLAGEVLDIIEANTQVDIISRTKFKESIDGFDDYWIKIRYNESTGWVYGGYVQLGKGSKLFLSEEDVVILNNHVIKTENITTNDDIIDRRGEYSRLLIDLYLPRGIDYTTLNEAYGSLDKEIESFSFNSKHDNQEITEEFTTYSNNLIELVFVFKNLDYDSLINLKIYNSFFDDPWGLGIGSSILDYTQFLGKGFFDDNHYVFDVNSYDWIGFGGIHQLKLILDKNNLVEGIIVQKYLPFDV